jgi:DNA polymerase IV
VKIRSSDFKTITRDKTLSYPTDQGRVIFETARKLIPQDYGPRIKVRLLGVRLSQLEKKKENSQLQLLDNLEGEKLDKSSQAVDKIRDRFGESAIKLAGTQI